MAGPRPVPFGAQLCVVIPVLNEEASIQGTIRSSLQGTCEQCAPEIVVVDGGSTDKTVQRATEASPHVRVLLSERGRGHQQNVGWRSTDRAWCLFLHGDSQLPAGWLSALQSAVQPSAAQPVLPVQAAPQDTAADTPTQGATTQLQVDGLDIVPGSRRVGRRLRPGNERPYTARCTRGDCACCQPPVVKPCGCSQLAGPYAQAQQAQGEGTAPAAAVESAVRASQQWGCFETIDVGWRGTWQGWLLRVGVTWRTRYLGLPYGDQALFASTHALKQVGGLPDWPLLEDCGLVRRLRRALGPPAILPLAVRTSARRWERYGYWRTCLTNTVIIIAWTLGVSPHTLARWYYGRKATAIVQPGAQQLPTAAL